MGRVSCTLTNKSQLSFCLPLKNWNTTRSFGRWQRGLVETQEVYLALFMQTQSRSGHIPGQ